MEKAITLNKLKCLILVFILLLMLSCGGDSTKKKNQQVSMETLININKELVNRDVDRIKAYVHTHQLEMNATESGLWYFLKEEGTGKPAALGEMIAMKYTVSLLDDTECYNSDVDGLKTFVLGQGGVESGLEEAALMLKKGSKGLFILPPHLAHGLLGDENKIPARSSIVYDVEVLSITHKQE